MFDKLYELIFQCFIAGSFSLGLMIEFEVPPRFGGNPLTLYDKWVTLNCIGIPSLCDSSESYT